MAEILDNEPITAETLNEISTDLGGDDLKFSPEEKFGNDKLNSITGDLVGSGILSIKNKCEPTSSDGKVWIDTGVIVFGNGAKKRITEKTGIDILTGGQNYIYAKNDTSTGKIYLTNSLSEPTGDFVILATVSEDGTVTDRRTLAEAKISTFAATNGWNATQVIEFNETLTACGTTKKQVTYDISGEEYKYLICLCDTSRRTEGLALFNLKTKSSVRYFYEYDMRKYGKSYDTYLFFNTISETRHDQDFEINFVDLTKGKLTLEFIYTYKHEANFSDSYTFTGTIILC